MNASQERKSMWRAGIIALVGLIVYVAIVSAIAAFAQPTFGDEWLLPIGILLALIPAALWHDLLLRAGRQRAGAARLRHCDCRAGRTAGLPPWANR